jgi:hypothetical protein
MGVEEQAAVENFRNSLYRGLAARIEHAAGTDVDMEVAWETLADTDIDYYEALSKVYFEPLIIAFQSIASNEAGAQFLRKQLKKVVIKNSGKAPGFSYQEGILVIDHKPSSEIEYVDQRAEELEQILKQNL